MVQDGGPSPVSGHMMESREQTGLSRAKNMLETCRKYLQACTLRYEVTYPVCCAGFAAGHKMMQCETQVDGHIFR